MTNNCSREKHFWHELWLYDGFPNPSPAIVDGLGNPFYWPLAISRRHVTNVIR